MELKYSNQFKVSANPGNGEVLLFFEQTQPIFPPVEPTQELTPKTLEPSGVSTEVVAPIAISIANARQLRDILDAALKTLDPSVAL